MKSSQRSLSLWMRPRPKAGTAIFVKPGCLFRQVSFLRKLRASFFERRAVVKFLNSPKDDNFQPCSTVSRIISSAHKKIAMALVEVEAFKSEDGR